MLYSFQLGFFKLTVLGYSNNSECSLSTDSKKKI